MKTQYSRRTSAFSTTAFRLPALIAAVIILALIILRVFFPSALAALASPLWSAGDFLAGKAAVADEAASARDARDALAASAEELQNENALLRARLEDVGAANGIPSESGKLVAVAARPPVAPYDVLILDAGTDDGITEDSIVYAKNIPIGTITEANAHSSRALLFSSSGRTTDGWIGKERLPVTLVGAGAGAFDADIPRELPVTEGDEVYLPGPGALPMGVVVRIEEHPSSPRSILHIRPAVSPFSLTWVRVKAAS